MGYNNYGITDKDTVCFYIRVSTDLQETSVENQIDLFKQFVIDNNIKNYEMFIDENLTGTEMSKRESFNDMITRCKNGEFNIMITKSITRYARNQRQGLQIVSELMECKCRCIFLEDNIDTSKDMQMIGLLLWIGENEARATSKKISFLYQNHFDEQGKIHNTNESYGYNYDIVNKTFVVNQKEKEVVIDIFNKYLYEGWGCSKIASYLIQNNIPTKNGGKWANNTVRKIIENPIYIGTLVQGKSVGIDVTIKKRNKKDKSEWKIHENKFEPIISKEMFDKVQLEIARRCENKHTRHSSTALFSGLIQCKECESTCTVKRKKHFKNYSIFYECIQYSNYGKTHCGHTRVSIYEYELIEILSQYLNEIKNNNYEDIIKLQKNEIQEVKNYKKLISNIDKEIDNTVSMSNKLLELYISQKISDKQYELQNSSLDKKLNELSEEKNKLYKEQELDKLNKTKKSNTKENVEILLNSDKWTNQMLRECIDKIYIGVDDEIEIKLL